MTTASPTPDADRILVAMSGGVDSSVAAALLHEQGEDLVGVTMHLWDAEGEQKVGRCCAPEDRDDARQTCEHLAIPHYVIDETDSFRTHVVEPFMDSYLKGETPSPCVHCNRTVKLTFLTQLGARFGAGRIATGHYARIERDPEGRPRLLRGRDRNKDQSYFLFGLSEEVLDRLVFPLGELVKDESRAHARRLGLPNADKPDSQELCFVPDGDVAGFIDRKRGERAVGKIVDDEGAALGEHKGITGYTIGQRRGLGLGGGPPRYVLRIIPDTQEVVVGPEEALLRSRLVVRDAHWLSDSGQSADRFRAQVRIRYRHTPAEAWVTAEDTGFAVEFDQPQRAVAPGQACVAYQGDLVLGGGFIAE